MKAVLITRPAHQVQPLQEALKKIGVEGLSFPTLVIQPTRTPEEIRAMSEQLSNYNGIIFVSPNAVRVLLSPSRDIQYSGYWAAVGPGTAAVLNQCGVSDVLYPSEKSGADALYRLLQSMGCLQGKRWLVCTGDATRMEFLEKLREAGAIVVHFLCYAVLPPAENTQLLTYLSHPLEAVIVTGKKGLENLWQVIPFEYQEKLKALPFLVVGEPAHRLTKKLGFTGAQLVVSSAETAVLIQGVSRLLQKN